MMSELKESPSQTAGPYVHIGCVPRLAGLEEVYRSQDLGAKMISGNVSGEIIEFTGCIYDGEGAAVRDALVEIWQAGPNGEFNQVGFTGWGRQACDTETGVFSFETLKPGSVGDQAPHILIWIVARGINLGLNTRAYFPDENNLDDPVFTLAGARASTLLTAKTETGYHLDVFLQGSNETVFFDV